MNVGGDSLSLHRQGFTLGELVIAMVVITLVVCVTLPITLSKMKKVDHVAYWMGYDLMKNISAELLQDILPKASNCQVELNGKCYGEAFSPEPLSYLECEQYKDVLGIGRCISVLLVKIGQNTCGIQRGYTVRW